MTGALCAVAGASTGPVIKLTTPVNLSYVSGGALPATTAYRVDNDSFIYTAANTTGAYTQAERWNSDATTVGNYEVRATLVSGATPTGSVLATWLGLATDREWINTVSPGNIATSNLTIEIRDVATSTVRATAAVQLFSDAT